MTSEPPPQPPPPPPPPHRDDMAQYLQNLLTADHPPDGMHGWQLEVIRRLRGNTPRGAPRTNFDNEIAVQEGLRDVRSELAPAEARNPFGESTVQGTTNTFRRAELDPFRPPLESKKETALIKQAAEQSGRTLPEFKKNVEDSAFEAFGEMPEGTPDEEMVEHAVTRILAADSSNPHPLVPFSGLASIASSVPLALLPSGSSTALVPFEESAAAAASATASAAAASAETTALAHPGILSSMGLNNLWETFGNAAKTLWNMFKGWIPDYILKWFSGLGTGWSGLPILTKVSIVLSVMGVALAVWQAYTNWKIYRLHLLTYEQSDRQHRETMTQNKQFHEEDVKLTGDRIKEETKHNVEMEDYYNRKLQLQQRAIRLKGKLAKKRARDEEKAQKSRQEQKQLNKLFNSFIKRIKIYREYVKGRRMKGYEDEDITAININSELLDALSDLQSTISYCYANGDLDGMQVAMDAFEESRGFDGFGVIKRRNRRK